ncbi:MAG: energy-coupling factor ABC transporter ATP-binding protein [Candidatus Asgardarchaeia archaeon]
MALIEVEHLFFRYSRSNHWILEDINLQISSGEFVLLLGTTGSGKTTLCRTFNGLIPHFHRGVYQGVVRVAGFEVDKTETPKLAKYIGYVFQNPENMLFSLNVEREIAFSLENLAYPKDTIIQRVDEVLSLLNIEHLRHKAPYELSGGEQQLVAIASVLALKPKIIIFDEPTANLDPLTADYVLRLIKRLNTVFGITIILVEHRLELVMPLASRVIVIDNGKIVMDGPPDEIINNQLFYAIGINVPKIASLFNILNKRYKLGLKPTLNIYSAANELEGVFNDRD